MWRGVIAFVLIPSLTPAQTMVAIPTASADLTTLQTPPGPYHRAYTYYKRIHPGSDEMAAFSFTLNPGAVLSHKSRGEGIVPMRLELKGDADLSISPIDYPMGYDRSFRFRRGTLNVLSETSSIHFKVKAARDAIPGTHAIQGRLIFQQVGDGGLMHPEQIDVELAVEVGTQSEANVAGDWPFPEPQKNQHQPSVRSGLSWH